MGTVYQNEVDRLNAIKTRIRTNLVAQGVTVPSDTTLSEMATLVLSVAGYTPQKGVDYWTPADQEEIVQQVITALGTPVFGRVDLDKKITLSTEHLADGTYEIGYEDKDGNWVLIGTLNAEGKPTYKNLLVVDTCQINKRTNSSGNVSDNIGGFLTDYIDLGDVMSKGGTNVLHYKGMYFNSSNWRNGSYEIFTYICYYTDQKTFIKNSDQSKIADELSADGDYVKTLDASYTNARYIRVTAVLLPNPSSQTTIAALTSKDQLVNCKLALNETITD